MTLDYAKKLLARLGSEIEAESWESLLEKLHTELGPMAIGSRLQSLGPLKYLYIGWNGGGCIGHLVTELPDLQRQLAYINQMYPDSQAKKNVIRREIYSRYLKDVIKALGDEIDLRNKTKRNTEFLAKFPTTCDAGPRTQHRTEAKIVEGLLAGETPAFEAFRKLMISDAQEISYAPA